MNRQKFCRTAAVITFFATLIANASADTLKVGDPAPRWKTGKFIQGDKVSELAKGKTYLIEFWATYRGPSRASIPHLNEIHNKFKGKGLVVIGVNCQEEDESLVAPFIKKMGDKMTFRVALDDKSSKPKGEMATAWLEAAGLETVPAAFLVNDKGIIVFIGRSVDLEDATIQQVLDGKFDVAKAKAAAEKGGKVQVDMQKNMEQIMTLSMELQQLIVDKKWDEASAKIDKIEKLLPDEARPNLNVARAQILGGRKDYPGMYQLMQKVSDSSQDNPMIQNQLAWTIVAAPDLEKRDLKLADKFAGRAVSASNSKDAAILDTQARVWFMMDKRDEAIKLQQKALGLAEKEDQPQYQKTLDSYKKGELPKVEE